MSPPVHVCKESVPEKWARFCDRLLFLFCLHKLECLKIGSASIQQASICWQTMNAWKTSLSQNGKSFVVLNCDESNVAVDVQKARGVLIRPPRNREIFYTQETTATRGTFSMLTWIASDPEVQKILPQFIIISKKLLSQRQYHEIIARCAPGIYVWRLDSSWLDASVFIACLKVVARCLQPLRTRFNFAVLLDCASIHIADEVLRSSRLLRLPLVFVPRNMTWLLQPCDTHLFRRFKSLLRRLHTQDITRRRCVRISLADCCRNAVIALQQLVLEQDWQTPFLSNGFVNHQNALSARIRKVLQVDSVDGLPDTMPTVEAVRSTLPRRKRILVELLRKPLPETPSPVLPAPPNRSPSVADRPRYPIGRPLFSRSPSLTRSESPRSAAHSPHAEPISEKPIGSIVPHDWKARLRPRDETNAAICGSRVGTTSERRPQVTPSSSSKEPWTPPR